MCSFHYWAPNLSDLVHINEDFKIVDDTMGKEENVEYLSVRIKIGKKRGEWLWFITQLFFSNGYLPPTDYKGSLRL